MSARETPPPSSVFVAVRRRMPSRFHGRDRPWWRQGRASGSPAAGRAALPSRAASGGGSSRLGRRVARARSRSVLAPGTAAQPRLEWRGVNFKPHEKTLVEVSFRRSARHARHRAPLRLERPPDDHPARHGLVGADFSRMMGLWWRSPDGSARARQRAGLRRGRARARRYGGGCTRTRDNVVRLLIGITHSEVAAPSPTDRCRTPEDDDSAAWMNDRLSSSVRSLFHTTLSPFSTRTSPTLPRGTSSVISPARKGAPASRRTPSKASVAAASRGSRSRSLRGASAGDATRQAIERGIDQVVVAAQVEVEDQAQTRAAEQRSADHLPQEIVEARQLRIDDLVRAGGQGRPVALGQIALEVADPPVQARKRAGQSSEQRIRQAPVFLEARALPVPPRTRCRAEGRSRTSCGARGASACPRTGPGSWKRPRSAATPCTRSSTIRSSEIPRRSTHGLTR